MIGKKVIVREDKAGVFFGTLEKKEGAEITLRNARKLYYWSGAGAVEGIAANGVSRPKDCKFTVWVDSIILYKFDQILPCTDRAIESIEEVPEWKF